MSEDHTRIVVFGGRDFRDAIWMQNELVKIQNEWWNPLIVDGDAAGADQFADCVSQLLGMPIERHPANWTKFGKAAGGIRNQEMVDSGLGYGLVFPGGIGTADMMRRLSAADVSFRKASRD